MSDEITAKGEAELIETRKESRSLYWTVGIFSFFVNLLILCLAGAVGVGIFAATAIALQIPEAHQLIQRLRSRFGR